MRLLGAAFPRASWQSQSEAVYTMCLMREHIPADVARRAVAALITEEMMLPPVALVLRRCREIQCQGFYEWRCPACGAGPEKVVGYIGGPGLCFECNWSGTLSEGDAG